MSGDGAELDVSKQALDQIAKGITDSLAELKELGSQGMAGMGGGFANLKLSGMETGHEGLTSTLVTFCERWGWGVRSLIQQANLFSVNVGLSAGAVHEQDQYIQGSFKVLANAANGNPYASEDDVIAKDWDEVLADNANAHVRDADYSEESFDQAWENSKEAWKDTVRDVNGSGIITSKQALGVFGLGDGLDAAVNEMVGPDTDAQTGGER